MAIVSVIIPAYNSEAFIGRALESVLSQSLKDLEIVIIDDGSTDGTRSIVEKYLRDARVRYERKNNGGVSSALNRGIAAATGKYIAVLHADDLFMPGKIAGQAEFMEDNPGIGISYTSEIYFLEGARDEVLSPYAKLSGDIFFFLKRNNFIHMSTAMFRRELLNGARFDEGLKCHEDWDLFLRLSAGGARFGYMPEALSRISINKTSLSADRSVMIQTGREVGERARRLWKRMKRGMNIYSLSGVRNMGRYLNMRMRSFFIGFPSKPAFNKPTPQAALAAMSSFCDIVIPVHDQPELTSRCLDSVIKNTLGRYRLILIDNASGPDTKGIIRQVSLSNPFVTIIENKDNLGWVKAVNQGIGISSGDYVCIMNNDTVVKTDGWTLRLIETAERDASIGLVNPAFDASTSSLKKVCIELDFCRGYCMLIKRAVIDRIGGLDESYGFGYYDDDDFSVRAIRAGFKCVRDNNVFVEHERDSTFKSIFTDHKRHELHSANKELFYSKWGKRLNIFFIVKKRPDVGRIKDLFLELARRQHKIYVWSFARMPFFGHVNIRMFRFARALFPFYGIILALNSTKKREKRFDLVFKIESEISDIGPIIEEADAISKK